jgi:hypothetical protein
VRAADPDLARVVTAWPSLPDQLRAAILSLIETVPNGARGKHRRR